MSDYLSGQRMLIGYRQGDADSIIFADSVATKFGVPTSCKIALPCSGNETLADYATFLTEVETPLSQWLTANPTLAAEIICIVICHGVPGYFDSAGTKISTTSRLSNIGNVFNTDATANPLAGTAERITKAVLGAGQYMCVRIDSDSLVSSNTILNATGSSLFLDGSSASAAALRSGSAACRLALTAGDMGAVGTSDESVQLDARAFYMMLQSGGTFAEAALVAASYMDSSNVVAGNPMLTLAGQAGRFVYMGNGSPQQIDWTQPVGWIPASSASGEILAPLIAGQKIAIGLRAISAAGTEERNTSAVCFAEIDGNDELQSAPLPKVFDVTADRIAEELVRVGFTCETIVGYGEPADFEIFGDSGTGTLDLENSLVSITNSDLGQRDFVVDVSATTFPCQFAVRPNRSSQAGPVSKTVLVSDRRQPSQPSVF